MNAAEYDAWYGSPRGRWIGETEFRLLGRLLAPRPGETLLDVGCGTGWFSRRFACAGLEVTAVDVDDEALAFARSRPGDRVRYVRGDARRLPFPDGAFDRVVSVTALCFVDDWEGALAEMARVSRHRFAVGLLNRRSLLWREKGRDGGRGAYRGARWHDVRELREALARLPASDVEVASAIFLPSGDAIARAVERLVPARVARGGFLAAAASPC